MAPGGSRLRMIIDVAATVFWKNSGQGADTRAVVVILPKHLDCTNNGQKT